MIEDGPIHADLVAAIQSQDVIGRYGEDAADPPHSEVAARDAVRACDAIGRSMQSVGSEIVASLRAAGITAVDTAAGSPRQMHHVTLAVPGVDEARRALPLLEAQGWSRPLVLSAGAERSFWHNKTLLFLLRPGDVTLTLDIRYGHSLSERAISQLLRPGSADWLTVDLPASLWWAYRVVHPIRLAASRLGLPTATVPEPFLTTPQDLIEPLLATAEVDNRDVVLDLGCGDGRMVVTAAERFGCRAIGVEQAPDRVRTARRRAAASPAAERIEIRSGDAMEARLDEATLVLMFLPMDLIVAALPAIIAQLPPGGRVMAHEQLPLPAGLSPPNRSVPVIGPASLTVAHLWNVTR